MIGAIMSFLPGLFKLGDKLIVDKDKKAEYAFKVQEFVFKTMEVLMNSKTYAWVDALVKLAYAAEQIVKGLFRPLVATCMFVFGIYAEMNDIVLSDGIQAILYGAFPAWGISRHVDKKEERRVKKKDNFNDFDDGE